MNIDDLLSPYRGFKPEIDQESQTLVIAHSHTAWRSTPAERGPALPSPDSWEDYDFVQDLPV